VFYPYGAEYLKKKEKEKGKRKKKKKGEKRREGIRNSTKNEVIMPSLWRLLLLPKCMES
jgi:hypothetical protein